PDRRQEPVDRARAGTAIATTARARVRASMSKDSSFTILSTKAPLVEVRGDGPIADVPGGLSIPDGAATTAHVDLLNAPVRRWRVDAPSSVKTAVVITDSPFGAFVGVRRCAAGVRPLKWWAFL